MKAVKSNAMSDRLKKISSSFASTGIHDLPTPLILEIALKLPVKSVARCKCVCKSWYELISSPFFASSYLSNPPFATFVLSVIPRNCDSLSFLEIGRDGGEDDDVIHTPFNLNKARLPEGGYWDMKGSCNGFVCLVRAPIGEFRADSFSSYDDYRYRNQVVYVFNPLSGMHMGLPHLSSDLYMISSVCYGFGSSISGNRFKVVAIVFGKNRTLKKKVSCEIFSVWEDGGWRDVDDSLIPKVIYSCGISVNGFLNWIGRDRHSCFIYAFEIGEERGLRMRLPAAAEAQLVFRAMLEDFELTLWDSKLCLCDFTRHLQVVIWKMEKYGVFESWTKDVIVKSSIPSDSCFNFLIPITTLRSGEILMFGLSGGSLLFVDLERKRSREVQVHDVIGIKFSYTYAPNFTTHLSS